MHLLAATPGGISDGSGAVDLDQSPGHIVVLSAADTELSSLAAAQGDMGDGAPSLRLANLMHLSHPLSVDLYVEKVIRRAKLVVVRLLGGTGYWPYGIEELAAACREEGVALAVVPGDDAPDEELARLGAVSREDSHRLWQYCVHGGPVNARNFLKFCAFLIGYETDWAPPAPLLRAGLYWPGIERPGLEDLRSLWVEGESAAAVVFYRAHLQAANLAPVDALIRALMARGLNPLPVYVSSLKDPVSAGIIEDLFGAAPPAVILNTVGFSTSSPGAARNYNPYDSADCPVLQVVLSGGAEDAWAEGAQGLGARDIAMNVALPEVDGRVLSRAVSFKAEDRFDAATQCPVVTYLPRPDRVDFVADLAANWARLRQTPAPERRVAVILANYPNRDGRMGNGVGLDTPASAVNVIEAMKRAGYAIENAPEDGAALVARLAEGPTNQSAGQPGKPRISREKLSLAEYRAFFATLPEGLRRRVIKRWGAPEGDPFMECSGSFALPVFRCGNLAIGLQPARGYNIDPVRSYHDPDLVPPHGYLAFYAWLREIFDVHCVIHMGKHGNMEWLPGKSLALSNACFPEAAFGPLPHLYPFIVNDPGEGTQAKRRSQAVIIDHLTPPLTRAETYGPLAELEQLVDEYYEAAGLDPRRLAVLKDQILDLTRSIGLDMDCGIGREDGDEAALAKLDNHLCELKEMQIRDGLHVFGSSPEGGQLTDLLVALVRIPRGEKDGDASLHRALAEDLGLGAFDPLDCEMGAPWTGPKPGALKGEGAWRTLGDTVERLENLARDLIAGSRAPEKSWPRAAAVLGEIKATVRPAVERCGTAEIEGILKGLDGRFVAPGPSGAPTRGRLDVLPTGKNFYSLDSRTVPTPAAWALGWKSASLLIERYRQIEGDWPRAMALSAWGTSNMRTGGDDIAQALALMGVQPVWETASRRVTGFEIMPLDVLDRPRIDVTLRVSGFFRDAFPAQIDLVASAARAVAALAEPPEMNPLADRFKKESQALVSEGIALEEAQRRAGYRVFGSKPGAYGAGLQALIDEHGWEGADDLARAYVAWGGYAYGEGAKGRAAHGLFESRLGSVDAVVQNQDNREHDLLDSDDYYQFEGGMTAAVEHLSGNRPRVFHNDHSRPESPRIRTLEEEIARVVRARVVNPKWIAGVMAHGYKGAFEMAATVDYLFAFSATTGAVGDHHFDAVFQAYLEDDQVRGFLYENNPDAARDMAARLSEALERGLWQPRSNSVHARLEELSKEIPS